MELWVALIKVDWLYWSGKFRVFPLSSSTGGISIFGAMSLSAWKNESAGIIASRVGETALASSASLAFFSYSFR